MVPPMSALFMLLDWMVNPPELNVETLAARARPVVLTLAAIEMATCLSLLAVVATVEELRTCLHDLPLVHHFLVQFLLL